MLFPYNDSSRAYRACSLIGTVRMYVRYSMDHCIRRRFSTEYIQYWIYYGWRLFKSICRHIYHSIFLHYVHTLLYLWTVYARTERDGNELMKVARRRRRQNFFIPHASPFEVIL